MLFIHKTNYRTHKVCDDNSIKLLVSEFFTTYKMKPPSKTKWMKKYVILFSAFIVLLFVVLLTVRAGYVDAKKIVDDTPTMAEKQVQKLPGLESLKMSLFNISENEDDFNQGIVDTFNQASKIYVNT